MCDRFCCSAFLLLLLLLLPSAFLALLPVVPFTHWANGKSYRQHGIIKMTFLAGKTHKIINRPEHALDIWHGKGLKNILYILNYLT